MQKKIVKKKKLKLLNFFILLLVITCISLLIYFLLQIKVQNIIIKNTNYLNDDYILDLAGIKNYPKYYSVSTSKIKKKIESSPYIDSAKVKRKFFNTFVIDIKESKALYYRDSDKNVVFSSGKSINNDKNFVIFRIPRLLNYVPNNIQKYFIKGMSEISDSILSRISDISYDPNDIDKERFLLYMDDGNMVYLTLTKFKMINYYNTVLEQLEGKKGILYLDNGNHFQIKE